MSKLMSLLFETNAFKVAEENNQFWYTSGKIGPYFINTHFIYGSEEAANELLKFIDVEKENKEEMPKKVYEKTTEFIKLKNRCNFIHVGMELQRFDFCGY